MESSVWVLRTPILVTFSSGPSDSSTYPALPSATVVSKLLWFSLDRKVVVRMSGPPRCTDAAFLVSFFTVVVASIYVVYAVSWGLYVGGVVLQVGVRRFFVFFALCACFARCVLRFCTVWAICVVFCSFSSLAFTFLQLGVKVVGPLAVRDAGNTRPGAEFTRDKWPSWEPPLFTGGLWVFRVGGVRDTANTVALAIASGRGFNVLGPSMALQLVSSAAAYILWGRPVTAISGAPVGVGMGLLRRLSAVSEGTDPTPLAGADRVVPRVARVTDIIFFLLGPGLSRATIRAPSVVRGTRSATGIPERG